MIDTFDKTILAWFQSIQNDTATGFLSILTKQMLDFINNLK